MDGGVAMRIDGVKVFTATKYRDREELGQEVTSWLNDHRHYELVDRSVLQSSDREFHCLSIVIWYRDRNRHD